MATHFSILAWKIPWTEEPGGLQSTGLQRVRHDWVMERVLLLIGLDEFHAFLSFTNRWGLTHWQSEGLETISKVSGVTQRVQMKTGLKPESVRFWSLDPSSLSPEQNCWAFSLAVSLSISKASLCLLQKPCRIRCLNASSLLCLVPLSVTSHSLTFILAACQLGWLYNRMVMKAWLWRPLDYISHSASSHLGHLRQMSSPKLHFVGVKMKMKVNMESVEEVSWHIDSTQYTIGCMDILGLWLGYPKLGHNGKLITLSWNCLRNSQCVPQKGRERGSGLRKPTTYFSQPKDVLQPEKLCERASGRASALQGQPLQDDQQDWQPMCLQDASFMVYELV